MGVKNIDGDLFFSTLHSEYVALSNFIRALISLKSLIKEVIEKLVIDSENMKFVSSSTVYEDNNGSIVVATSSNMTAKSNHISVKYNWFRQHVGK